MAQSLPFSLVNNLDLCSDMATIYFNRSSGAIFLLLFRFVSTLKLSVFYAIKTQKYFLSRRIFDVFIINLSNSIVFV
jgi:hypothetical protein